MTQASTGNQLLRSSAVVAVGTGLSRLTGLARTVMQGIALGKVVGDVFNGANTAPNLLYDLLLGGILAATLVPVFVENLEHDDDEATSAVVTVLGLALLVVTVASLALVPVLSRAFSDTSTERDLVTALLLMFLPQIFFYGVTTLASGLLNSRKRFAAAAFAPVLNNVVAIAVLVTFTVRAGAAPTLEMLQTNTGLLWLLGIGTTVGIAAQAVILLPFIPRAGIHLEWRFEPRNTSVRSVLRLSGWTFGYVATNVATIGFVVALAEHSPVVGSTTAYTYAYQFFQLPYGLLAASVITAFMPELSRLALGRDLSGFGERFLLALRITAFLVVPAAIAYLVLARPMVSVLLEYRSFDADLAQLTADTLWSFAVGLPSFCLYLLAMRGFYAFKDTRTPFLVNVAESALNVGLALVLVGPRAGPGLALAFALSYVVFGFVAVVLLDRRVGGLPWRGSVSSLVRIAGAAAAMAGVLVFVRSVVGSSTGSGAVVQLGVAVTLGAAVYLAACAALKLPELRQATGILRRGG